MVFRSKRYIFLVFLLIIISLTGCEKYQDVKSKLIGSRQQPNITTKETCEISNLDSNLKLDAVIYYFNDDIYPALERFIINSNEYLMCSFVRLDSYYFTELLINKNDHEVEVRLLFDKDATMDCTTACVPYSVSQYNNLFAGGIEIRTASINHQNFCISEDALFVTSAFFDDIKREDYALVIKSNQLRDIFKEKFNKLWG